MDEPVKSTNFIRNTVIRDLESGKHCLFNKPFIESDFIVTTTNAEGSFAIGDGLPAIIGDLHVEIHLDNNDWEKFTVVRDVEISTQHIADIGTILYAPR